MERRSWDGKAVHVALTDPAHDRRHVDVGLTEDAARKLALTLAKAKQTYFFMPPEIEELLDALNHVLVGDPTSRARHRTMEAGKGMTPDGGYRPPGHTYWPSEHSTKWEGFRCGWKLPDGELCGRSEEEHNG